MSKKELTTKQENLPQSKTMGDALLDIVSRTDIDPERLEKFLDLQFKYEDRQAEKALSEALAAFQSECPIIPKTKQGHNTKYAPLDEVVFKIKPLLDKFGLSYSFDTAKLSDEESKMIVTIRHKDGAKFVSNYNYLSLDASGSKNSSQGKRSANSYARRTALENALGIVTQDQDDDARRCIDQYATDSQIEEIKSIASKTKTSEKTLLAYLKVDDFSELSEYEAKKAILQLKQKRATK